MGRESTGSILERMNEAQAVAVLRSLAAACSGAAQSHYKDASLLYCEGRVPGAYALAVIGVEEFAKAVLYTVTALRPKERGHLGLETRSHEVKHMVAAHAEQAHSVVAESWRRAEHESALPVRQRACLEDLFRVLCQRGVSSLLEKPKQAKAFYADLRRKFPQHLLEPDFKDAALYVDLLPTGEVVTPERVMTQLGSPLLSLEWLLEVYRGIDMALTDDAEWERLVQDVDRTAPPRATP